MRLTETMIRITKASIGANGRVVRDRPFHVFVAHHGLKDARGRLRRFASRGAAKAAARAFIAEQNQEQISACVASMGCLCAGHARGDPATDACDTRELPQHVGTCDFCGEENVPRPAVLVDDPDQRVCAVCHEHPRIPTVEAP